MQQTAKAIEKIEHIHTILEKTTGTMGDEKATIYDPSLPFHRQAARLVGCGGTANLLGIPYTLETVYFKPVMINGNEYYISLNKKTEIGSDNGVYLYNKLSFAVSGNISLYDFKISIKDCACSNVRSPVSNYRRIISLISGNDSVWISPI